MTHYIYQHSSGKRSTPIPANDARLRRFFERGGWVVVEVINDEPATVVVEADPLDEQGESDETGTVCGTCVDPDCDGDGCGERRAVVDG